MATVGSAVSKIQYLLLQDYITTTTRHKLEEILAVLTDPTVLLIEWNEIDIQEAARKRLASIEGCDVERIIDEPLAKEKVEFVIKQLASWYDANSGITYIDIDNVLNEVTLPASDCCFKKTELELQIEEAEKYITDLISETKVVIDHHRLEKIRKVIETLKNNQKE